VNYFSPEVFEIAVADESDAIVVERLARSFDLDCEEFLIHQFVVAKVNDEIIGFGRLRKYPDCTEVATVGVIPEERNKGIGTAIVNELIRIGPKELFVTCVIPSFFSRLGFHAMEQYPSVLQKKVDFCKLYDFSDDQIFVMAIKKNESGNRGAGETVINTENNGGKN